MKIPVILHTHDEKVTQQYCLILSPLLKEAIELNVVKELITVEHKKYETGEEYCKRQAILQARFSNCLTIAQITEYIIPALHNQSSTIQDVHSLEIKEPACIKRIVVAIANPTGNYKILEHCILGSTQLQRTASLLPETESLEKYFFIDSLQKFETDCTVREYCHELDQLKVHIAEAILYYIRKDKNS